MMAIMADIIASVEPQQMVISRSGSYLTPWVRSNFSTVAARSGFAPQVMAYWLMSSAMALRAASLISSGAAKSGNPWDRLTARCFKASRVISRITDSVNCSAFAESMRREICAMERSGAVIAPSQNDEIVSLRARMPRPCKERPRYTDNVSTGVASGGLRGHARLPINHPVDFGVAQDDLHILAGFRERNGLDELRDLIVVALGLPGGNAVFSGVIGSGRVFQRTRLAHQARNVNHAKFNVVVWLEKFVLRVADFELLGKELSRLRKNLHQADRVGVRDGVRLKRGFLADEAGGKHGIEIVFGGFAAQRRLVGERIERLPCSDGQIADLPRIEIRHDDAGIGHAGAVVTLIESRLRGF